MAIEDGDLAEAEVHLKRLDARWPGNSRVKINRAHILLKKGQPREALSLVREGVAASPFYYTDEVSRGHQVLSLIHAALKEKDDAAYHDLLARKIKGSVDSFRASIGALEETIAKKNIRLAEKIAAELSRKFSGNSLFCLKLAELARLKGEWPAALSYAEKASRESNPRYVKDKLAAWRFLEDLHSARGSKEKALACREAIARCCPACV
jgi:predicted Zn-dependent protease